MPLAFLSSLGLFLFLCLPLEQKAQVPQRYLQPCFDSLEIRRDVCYSSNVPSFKGLFLGKERQYLQDLKMDIFLPPATDTLQKRPVILLAHGGGFVDVPLLRGTLAVGDRHNEDMQALADSFARRGFIAASISYRLGFNPLSRKSYERAVWRAAQDMSAALRFVQHNAEQLRADPRAVFIGGSSAGAISALHCALIDSTERWASSRQLRAGIPDLGALHSQAIIELPSDSSQSPRAIDSKGLRIPARAVVAYWGALLDSSYLRGAAVVPLLLFHGEVDAIVPPYTAPALSGLFRTAPILHGGGTIAQKSAAYAIPHRFYLAAHQGHEYWGALNGRWVAAGPSKYWADIIAETARFFCENLPDASKN